MIKYSNEKIVKHIEYVASNQVTLTGSVELKDGVVSSVALAADVEGRKGNLGINAEGDINCYGMKVADAVLAMAAASAFYIEVLEDHTAE